MADFKYFVMDCHVVMYQNNSGSTFCLHLFTRDVDWFADMVTSLTVVSPSKWDYLFTQSPLKRTLVLPLFVVNHLVNFYDLEMSTSKLSNVFNSVSQELSENSLLDMYNWWNFFVIHCESWHILIFVFGHEQLHILYKLRILFLMILHCQNQIFNQIFSQIFNHIFNKLCRDKLLKSYAIVSLNYKHFQFKNLYQKLSRHIEIMCHIFSYVELSDKKKYLQTILTKFSNPHCDGIFIFDLLFFNIIDT